MTLDCLANCASCTDLSTCTSCDPGYNVISGLCQSCPSRTFYNSLICESMNYKYSLSKIMITDCPANCASCTGLSTCTSCDPGYNIISGVCGTCPARTFYNSVTCASKTSKL